MNENRAKSTITRCGLLAAVVVLLGLLLAFPAYAIAGVAGLEGLSYAAALCLLPGWVVIALSDSYGVAKFRVAPVLIGMGIRFGAILGGVLIVMWARPQLRFREFLVWVVIYYMVTLAFETSVLMRETASKSNSSTHNSGSDQKSEVGGQASEVGKHASPC